jgi:hypothetical protein
MRLVAPSPSAAREAVSRSVMGGGSDATWDQMASSALGLRVPCGIRTAPNVGALRRAINTIGPTTTPFGEGPSDSTLLVLVRALPLDQRQALTLLTLYGIGPGQAAEVARRSPDQLEELRLEAVRSLHGTLGSYANRQLHGAVLAPKGAARLRPLPVFDGMAVVRGTRVYIDPNAPVGMVGMFIKLLERLQERLRHALHLPDPLDDDAGDSNRHRALDPTPTAKPIRKPRPTPSLEPHRMPKPTRGTGVHRRAPQMTPSTQRLSASSRPSPKAGNWNARFGR